MAASREKSANAFGFVILIGLGLGGWYWWNKPEYREAREGNRQRAEYFKNLEEERLRLPQRQKEQREAEERKYAEEKPKIQALEGYVNSLATNHLTHMATCDNMGVWKQLS